MLDMKKRYWLRRVTEPHPDPHRRLTALRYAGKVEIFCSPEDAEGPTRLVAVVDSVEEARLLIGLANEVSSG